MIRKVHCAITWAWKPTTVLCALVLFLQQSFAASNEPYLVKDINPGSRESAPLIQATMSGFAFFSANDGSHGQELWKSDGTEQGTLMVKDINPGPADSEPLRMLAILGTLYFAAEDGEHGRELWKSDGTEAGTVMVMDINPGSGSSYPSELQQVGNKLLFKARDGSHGEELWALDLSDATGSIYLPLALRTALW